MPLFIELKRKLISSIKVYALNPQTYHKSQKIALFQAILISVVVCVYDLKHILL